MFFKCGLMPFFAASTCTHLRLPLGLKPSDVRAHVSAAYAQQTHTYNKFYRVSVADRVVFELVYVRSIPWLYSKQKKSKKKMKHDSNFVL